MVGCASGADPGFDQRGGGPDRDRPKTAILGPQFCRILVLGPHFWWSGGPGPPGPPWIRPCAFSSPVSVVDMAPSGYLALFGENVCENDRTGSRSGGRRSPENFVCRSANV